MYAVLDLEFIGFKSRLDLKRVRIEDYKDHKKGKVLIYFENSYFILFKETITYRNDFRPFLVAFQTRKNNTFVLGIPSLFFLIATPILVFVFHNSSMHNLLFIVLSIIILINMVLMHINLKTFTLGSVQIRPPLS